MSQENQVREKPLHELLSRDMVDLYVGQENTHWILHEKLLCHRSPFFRSIFYGSSYASSSSKTFGLPEEDDEPFRLFVGWLYSSSVRVPTEEKDLGNLFDLYLMGEKWQITGLIGDVLETVRLFYQSTGTYPGLRRVQYVYANTFEGSPMRKLLVGSVARYLALSDSGIPQHWDKALRKNGQLAVDIIRAIQEWRLRGDEVPDPREDVVQRARGADTKGIKEEQVEDEKKLDELKKKIKKEDGEEGEKLVNGLTNGMKGMMNGDH